MNKNLRNVLKAAEREGVTNARIEDRDTSSRHARLIGIYQGKPFEMVVCRGTSHKEVVSVRNWIRRNVRRRDELARMREANAVR